MTKPYVELTEEEASLVLSNWWFVTRNFGDPLLVEVLPARRARALDRAVSHYDGPFDDLTDRVAACIRVVRRRRP